MTAPKLPNSVPNQSYWGKAYKMMVMAPYSTTKRRLPILQLGLLILNNFSKGCIDKFLFTLAIIYWLPKIMSHGLLQDGLALKAVFVVYDCGSIPIAGEGTHHSPFFPIYHLTFPFYLLNTMQVCRHICWLWGWAMAAQRDGEHDCHFIRRRCSCWFLRWIRFHLLPALGVLQIRTSHTLTKITVNLLPYHIKQHPSS